MNFISKILSKVEEPVEEIGPADATHISAQKPITVTTTKKKKRKNKKNKQR